MRAIAAELVRQTPFRAQRCLNFLEILTICPRGPVPLPDSPTESRRRSRSELRCWPGDSPTEKSSRSTATILEESRRRARSELRGWSSSNSSDEDLLGDFRSIPAMISKEQPMGRTWGCSESSEGSDDSLPWSGVCRSSSVDPAVSLPEPETREQRIQRYKEARRRENEARSRRVLEEDARRRKARAEENNNDILKTYGSGRSRNRLYNSGNDNDDNRCFASARKEREEEQFRSRNEKNIGRLPPVKPSVESPLVRFEEDDRNEDDKRNNNAPRNGNPTSPGILRADTSERRSRARERRGVREKSQLLQTQQFVNAPTVETLQERKERLAQLSSRIPVPRQLLHVSKSIENWNSNSGRTSSTSLSILTEPPCEEDVARLLERCQRVDHYVPVREKLTLFESLSRLGGRLARSTEDLGRTSSKPSPRGKQRARSLHDLNRGARAVPVREMCRFFEGDVEHQQEHTSQKSCLAKTRFSDPVTPTRIGSWKDPAANSKGNEAPCVRSSTRRKHYLK